jgi:hypothetical protein
MQMASQLVRLLDGWGVPAIVQQDKVGVGNVLAELVGHERRRDGIVIRKQGGLPMQVARSQLHQMIWTHKCSINHRLVVSIHHLTSIVDLENGQYFRCAEREGSISGISAAYQVMFRASRSS